KEAKAAKAKLSKEEKAALKAEEKARKEKEKEDKPKFATLLKGQSIETITLEEALKLFDLPRTVGEFEGKVVVAAIGRFGPFIRHDAKFVSIPKGYDPLSITLDEAIALIEAKRKADSEKFIKSFEEDPELQILNGRFGPYISYQKKNFKIPKDTEPASLSLEDCMKIVNEPAKPAARKRAATKKKA
ncbi:MAG: topoisomerase C-terminal repeat-containing protein, partial [Tannerellaceae bacterium]